LVVIGIASSLGLKATGHGRLDGTVETLGPIRVGSMAPDADLESLDGARLSLSDLRGTVTVVEFGATWCGPCRGMLRPLRTLSEQTSDGPVNVVTVHVGEDRDHVKAHYARRPTGSLQILVDADAAAGQRFGVQSFPTIVLLDRQGIVRLIHVGAFFEMDSVRAHIRKWSAL
jgi:thiol-disulfide isomerase/thioredoxin